MEINTDNAKRLDAFIAANDCRKPGTEPVFIQDQRRDLDVYRLRLDLVFFNIRNGRFAAEYRELCQEEGRDLNSEDNDDAKKIQKLLLEPKKKEDFKQTKILEEDLMRFGQKYPGIISWDGYLINGNRRMAVLKKIKEDTGKDEFGYIVVARLPKGVSESDVWKIEAGIQLSRQEKLDYGPINTLLKLREGKNAGLSEKQIANSLYGGFTEKEIEHELERLKLIEQYLEYTGQPKMYSKVRVHEHFIALQDILDYFKEDSDISGEDLLKVQKIAFELIRNGVKFLQIRKISSILKNKKAREKFLTASEQLPDLTSMESDNSDQEKQDEKSDEDDEDDEDESPVYTIFIDSKDIVDAEKEKEKPFKLLKRVLTSLEALDLSSPHLNESESKSKISKIVDIVEKLKKFVS